MKEDFVTYNLAVKLKEKGFDWTCMAHFNTITYNEPTLNYNVTVDDIRGSNFKSLNKLDSFIDAPTISQVLKWLRKKNIYITLNIGYCYETDSVPFYENPGMKPIMKGYYYGIWLLDDLNDKLGHSEYYRTYEDAALAGIEYVLDNII